MNEFVVKQVEMVFVKNKKRFSELQMKSTVIKIVGIGGAGHNILRSIMSQIQGPTFIDVDTDFNSLSTSSAPTKIKLGVKTTKGFGTNSTPEIGRKAAQESLKEIIEAIEGADIIILVAGMGGGTGTGATQVISDAALTLGIFTIGLVVLPFEYEGNVRVTRAKEGISELGKRLDSLIAIPNDQLCCANPNSSLFDTFAEGDKKLVDIIQNITAHLTKKGINGIGKGEKEGQNKSSVSQSDPSQVRTVVCWECKREYAYENDSCPFCFKYNLNKRAGIEVLKTVICANCKREYPHVLEKCPDCGISNLQKKSDTGELKKVRCTKCNLEFPLYMKCCPDCGEQYSQIAWGLKSINRILIALVVGAIIAISAYKCSSSSTVAPQAVIEPVATATVAAPTPLPPPVITDKEGRINAATNLTNKFASSQPDLKIYAKGYDCDVMHVETSSLSPEGIKALANGDANYEKIIPGGINIYAHSVGFKDILYTSTANNGFESFGSGKLSRFQITNMKACSRESDKKEGAPAVSAKEGRVNAANNLTSRFETSSPPYFDVRAYAKGENCDVMHVVTSNFLPTMMEALANGSGIYGTIVQGGINRYASYHGFKDILFTSRADNSFESYGSGVISRNKIIKMKACSLASDKKEIKAPTATEASADKGRRLVKKIHKQYGIHSFYAEPSKFGAKMVIWIPKNAWNKLSSEQKDSIESYVKSFSPNWAIGVGRVEGTDIMADTHAREN